MTLSLGEKVGRLEEGTVELLFAGMPYVNVVATYNGELGDRPKLVEALKTLKGEFPLVLLGYAGGETVEVGRPSEPDGPVELIQQGTLDVVACCDDSRAQYKRLRAGQTLTRKGGQALSHRMFSDIQSILSGRQLTAAVEGEEEPAVLNSEELIPRAVEYIERITGLTAVSVPFSLSISYSTPDHREPYGGEITTINFGIEPITTAPGLNHPPGVFPDLA